MEEIGLLCAYLESIEKTLEQHQGEILPSDAFRKILTTFKKASQCLSLIEEQSKTLSVKKTNTKISLLKKNMEQYWLSMTDHEGIKPIKFHIRPDFMWKNRMLQLGVSREARKLKFCINNL